jgi:hypothetical protein
MLPLISVADPHHGDADQDPSFQFDADPYPTFLVGADAYPDPTSHSDADPDPAPNQSDVNLRPLVYRPSTAHFLSLCAVTESVHGPLWLHIEHPELLNFLH